MLETGELEDQRTTTTDDGAIGPEDLGRFVVTPSLQACQGRRLRPEALAVKLGERNIAELSALPLRSCARCSGRARWQRGTLRARCDHRRAVAPRRHRATRLPHRRRARLPDAGPCGSHPVRRRGPAHPPRHANRSLAGRRALRARRAQRGPARPRQREAARSRPPPGRTRATASSWSSTTATPSWPPTTCSTWGRGPERSAAHRRRGNPGRDHREPGNSVTGPYLSGEKRLPVPKTRKKPGKKTPEVVGARAHNLKRRHGGDPPRAASPP